MLNSLLQETNGRYGFGKDLINDNLVNDYLEYVSNSNTSNHNNNDKNTNNSNDNSPTTNTRNPSFFVLNTYSYDLRKAKKLKSPGMPRFVYTV